jgi:hypothetical protein
MLSSLLVFSVFKFPAVCSFYLDNTRHEKWPRGNLVTMNLLVLVGQVTPVYWI